MVFDFTPFEQHLTSWVLIYIGLTTWVLIVLNKFKKEVKPQIVEVEKIKFIEVPKYITPKKVEVRRIIT